MRHRSAGIVLLVSMCAIFAGGYAVTRWSQNTRGQVSTFPTVSPQRPAQSKDLPLQIKDVLNAETPLSKRAASHALFWPTTDSELLELTRDPHHEIALMAAWETAFRAVNRNAGPANQRPAIKPTEFLELLRARLKTELPQWWEQMVLSAELQEQGHLCFFYLPEPEKWPYHRTAAEYFAPRDQTITREGGNLQLRIGDQTAQFKEAVAELLRYSPIVDQISGCILGEKCFVTLHSNSADPCHILCCDRNSGKVIWMNEVWASGGGVDRLGLNAHFITVSNTERALLVFGGASDAVYVEGFDRNDGKNLFRFTSACLNHFSSRR